MEARKKQGLSYLPKLRLLSSFLVLSLAMLSCGLLVSYTQVFADGWLDAQTGEYLGRPVDVAQLRDGSILVSDDLVGAVYRISYGN